MKANNFAENYRAIIVASVAGEKSLKVLIDAALAAKSAPANTLPEGTIIQIALTPDATLLWADSITKDFASLAANTRKIFPFIDPLSNLIVKNAANVLVELYFVD